MPRFIRSTLAAGALAMYCVPASAATPHLNGTYLFHLTGLCQATLVVATGGGNLQALRGGGMTQSVGTISFTPYSSRGQKGKVTAKYTMVDGAALRIVPEETFTSVPGVRMTQTVVSGNGTYTMDGSTITLRFNGLATQVFRAYYGDINESGRSNQVHFVRLIPGTPDGQETLEEDCSESGTLDRRS